MHRLILFSACLCFFATSCSKNTQKQEKVEEALPITSLVVEAKDLEVGVRVMGSLDPAEKVAVYPKLKGKWEAYSVEKGSRVEKGELIGTVDRDEVGFKFQQAPIYAPLSGIISDVPLSPGAEVSSGTLVCHVMQVETLKVACDLPEQIRSQLCVGQQVHLMAEGYPGRTFYAEVTSISPLVESRSHTVNVEARLANPNGELAPGMFVAGELILSNVPGSIVLPEEAVLSQRSGHVVYKIVDGAAQLVPVQVGVRRKGEVQITEGIVSGDQVIVGGNHKVFHGQKVKERVFEREGAR